MKFPAILCICVFAAIGVGFFAKPESVKDSEPSWIRINQLGYKPNSKKVAVWVSKTLKHIREFELKNAKNGKTVFKGDAGKNFGAYGPFSSSHRLDFSSFTKKGKYYLQVGNTKSPVFEIGPDVYKGTADFALNYMRQQRCGYNPYLKDSCHTHDGYTLYGPMPDSTYIDVTGGWHDATDYLQYVTTSANATYQLLIAYRDFPKVFGDTKQANGLDGKNGIPDVLDEAKWGLDWLIKMHPREDWMFNQIADDRDHISLRIPKLDSQYNRGYQRPVYFLTGEPQQRGKFMNTTTGTSSTAGKFTSAFATGAIIFNDIDPSFSELLLEKSTTAHAYANKKHGYTQTASVLAPYIYAEENWYDDMELAYATRASLFSLIRDGKWKANRKPNIEQLIADSTFSYIQQALYYADKEPLTPWLGKDTAHHYQWYPFINAGHMEVAKIAEQSGRQKVLDYYKKGIQAVYEKGKNNPFLRGVPFIWCSNNLTVNFVMQCYWYRTLSGDNSFEEFEQANFDWLFGCNPWGTSFVYGLPANGDYPEDPHAAFTRILKDHINGGLVDGPVYGNIFKSLIGINMHEPDEYAEFQSDLVVYHDDYGDYSTNEPTMCGTASLIYLLAAKESEAK